jgi:hypothetical protein
MFLFDETLIIIKKSYNIIDFVEPKEFYNSGLSGEEYFGGTHGYSIKAESSNFTTKYQKWIENTNCKIKYHLYIRPAYWEIKKSKGVNWVRYEMLEFEKSEHALQFMLKFS